jgi:hypothetical protein
MQAVIITIKYNTLAFCWGAKILEASYQDFNFPNRPGRPNRLLPGAYQDLDRPDCPNRLLPGSLIFLIVLVVLTGSY